MRRVAYCQDISALPLAVSHWLGWEAGKPLVSRFVGYNDVECYFKILFKKFLYIMIHGDTYKNKAVTLRRTTVDPARATRSVYTSWYLYGFKV